MKRNKSLVNYLSNISLRLSYIYKNIKPTGSFYLHCDPTASHYLKIVLDYIFGMGNFRNEIIWHYHAGNSCKNIYKKKHDIIFFYTKSLKYIFTTPTMEYSDKDIKRFNLKDENNNIYRINHTKDKEGNYKKYYLEKGTPQDDVFSYLRNSELTQIGATAKERLGYPTQKPEALLERIIQASSNEGDLIADFYLGGGTTAAVCKKLNRNFIGCDISELSIKTVNNRLNL